MCIFCQIINHEIPSEFLFEDEIMAVFRDIKPKAKYHFLIVPKEHMASVNEIDASRGDLIGKMVVRAKELAKDFGFAESGYKLIINCGQDGGQMVSHLHMHLLGGEPIIGVLA